MKNAESLLPCHCEDVPVAIHDRGTNSVVQGSQICHCEGASRPWQSREGTADIHRVPPSAIATKFDCSGAQRAPWRLAICAALPLWRKAIRFVIARSEATWQSRRTRPDNREVIGEIATAFPRLPRPLRGLAMTSRRRLPFYRQPVPAVSALPGAACRSPTMAGAINVTAFPRLHPKGTSSRFALRAPRRPLASSQ